MKKLVQQLIQKGILYSDEVIKAFERVDRKYFVPQDLESQAYKNIPLPIGQGQTISQPQTVAFMLELLQPQAGQHILDVGSGSGWTTALLAEIVGRDGVVTAMEVVSELCKMGQQNIKKIGLEKKSKVQFYCQSAENGLEKNAPYDRILVSASVKEVPGALKKQLALGGKMVLPVGNEIWCLTKETEENFVIEKFPGFIFVPFVKK